MKIKKTTESRLKADLGQFFLEDRKILREVVEKMSINKGEIVLEIGTGDGRITRLLAERAKKVITIEIDKELTPNLKKLPKNVSLMVGDALEILSRRSLRKIDKIVGNLPSAIIEPLFWKLTKIKFSSAVFLVPEKFAYKCEKQPVLSLYFSYKLICKVPKSAFSPVPRTNWEILKVEKLPDPLVSGNFPLYLKRYLVEHPQAKLKNSLTEALIRFNSSQGKVVTKNQAREIIGKLKISRKDLEFSFSRFPLPERLSEPVENFTNIFSSQK